MLDWLFNRHPASSRTIAVLHYVDGLTLDAGRGGNRPVRLRRAQTAQKTADPDGMDDGTESA